MATSPGTELHVWRARLDSDGWPREGELPAEEREQAASMLRLEQRRRWVAARWALRRALGHYLELDPTAIELRPGDRGKPFLADPAASLRFNLSHSDELALIAVAERREVGVDVQRVGSRHPAQFYVDWTRREAIAKCHGTGLWTPLPDAEVAVTSLEAGVGFAAAVAVAGGEVPEVRRFELEPGRA